MFSVKAKPTPTMPAYTMPSRTPSSSERRHHSRRKRKRPLLSSSATGRADLEHPVVGDPADEAADALEQQRDRGGDEDAPQQAAGEEAPRLGLVAVEPQEAGDERAHRYGGEQSREHGRAGGSGHGDDDRHRDGAEEHQSRHHDREDGTLAAGTGHAGSLPKRRVPLRAHTGRGRRLSAVSEQTPDATTDQTSETLLHTESHDPAVPAAYSAFMRQGWGDRELDLPPHPITPYAAARRQRLAEAFPGERLVLPAGGFKVRSYDTDYRFRPDTAHTYFCGNQTSDAVLVVDGGESILYARPRSERNTDEFFRDRQYGELWVGRRPSLKEISDSLGLEVRHIDRLGDDLSRGGKTRVHRGVSETVDRLRRRRREPRRRLRPRGLRDAAAQGRVGGRRAPDRLRHHHPRLHRLRGGVGPGAGVRRALGGGHLLPSGAGDGQRHRLRLDRRRRLPRDHAALDRQHRADQPR